MRSDHDLYCERPPSADPADTAPAVLTIDLAAIVANYRFLRDRIGGASCAAVVKADAYGLGAARVAPALAAAGCRLFFVAQVEEGVALRGVLGTAADIAILNGSTPGGEEHCAAYDLIPVLNDEAQRNSWKALAARRGRRLPAMLQVDTGTARFGYPPDVASRLSNDPTAFEGIDLQLVMSHLACADDADDPANAEQHSVFASIRRCFPGVPASLAASSGIFLGTAFHFDAVRPGAALYGIAPRIGRPNPLWPVVGLKARVMQVRSVRAGTPVGYGHTAITGRASRLATVAVGYADGFLRSASGAMAYFGGNRLPMLGRVSMDSIVLDATDLPPQALGPGTLVDLIGPERDVDAVASAAGTIGYEVLTSLGSRFHRTYLDA